MLTEEDDHEAFPERVEMPDSISRDEIISVIPYVDGKCPHLDDESNRCTIYDRRPHLCREFNCVSGLRPNGTVSFFLQDNPDLIPLIQARLSE